MNKIQWYFLCMLAMVSSLQSMNILRTKYAWPDQKPYIVFDPHSMFVNERQLGSLLNNDMRLIVELGSWLGGSTRFILDHAPHAMVIAIDHWQGSAEHQDKHKAKLSSLYQTFLSNCWTYRSRLIPMKTTTLQGLEELFVLGLKPDLVYIDASHNYDAVMQDLEKIYTCFLKTIICGDDWCWNNLKGDSLPVRRAVIDFSKQHNLKIISDREFWLILE